MRYRGRGIGVVVRIASLYGFFGLSGLLALVALTAAPATAGDVPTLKYRDATYKFSFAYADGWDQVPIEAGDSVTVCKFIARGAEAKGITAARFEVWRSGPSIDQKTTTPSDGAGGASGDDKPAMDLVKAFNRMLKDDGWEGELRAGAGKAVTSKDGVPGSFWELEAKKEDKPNKTTWTTFYEFASFAKPESTLRYALCASCDGPQAKKNQALFRRMIESFLLFDEKAKEVQGLDILNGLPISAEKKREIERGMVKGWNVIVSPKKNYIVVYNTMGKRNDELAKMIASKIEQIREQVYEVHFPPVKKIEVVSVIRVCGGREEYLAYGAPPSSAGYWSPSAEELVFYDESPARKIDEDTLSVLYHEAFHQYIHYSTDEIAPASWFNEGHGDYYAGARSAGKAFKISPFLQRVGTVKVAIRAGASPKKADGSYDRKKGGYTPLEDLVHMSQDQYYEYMSVHYAQGWSVIWFLREIVPKNAKWNEKWGQILATYFNTLKGTETPPATNGKPSKPSKPTPPPTPTKPGKPGAGGDVDPLDPPDPSDPSDPKDPGAVPFTGAPPGFTGGVGGRRGDLDEALEKAFKGIDWKEFEEAWKASILEVPG